MSSQKTKKDRALVAIDIGLKNAGPLAIGINEVTGDLHDATKPEAAARIRKDWMRGD